MAGSPRALTFDDGPGPSTEPLLDVRLAPRGLRYLTATESGADALPWR